MSILAAEGLTKRFGGLTAVEDVSFEVPRGEVRALIGPNGAGKTTLVGMISGRIEPSAGRVTFDGRDITRLPAHKRIMAGMAYTFQITSVFTGLSVRENVALAARRHLRHDETAQAVENALARVGLADRIDQEAGDLSYGHQRLLEIAMGLVQRPRLLILDEPTQGLSDGEIEGFKALVRELAGDTTILLIEHNMSVVMEVADRVTVLNFGEVLAHGTPDEIHHNADVQAAYLGTG
ncbi:ABC transporter ATP-binding protein [Roseovarius sp. SCSIO 43702]|uniref:ABC transporter ATP-binding protein n=1 Tax=Roseovarius sp. SCSIO 43702 TaxID=2823043 RepID=UPI001C72EE6B|nr:ABC transporter ATP-binding protein [Roseovarius sp. SCSIO 43702]QYX57244.1 ABC transporter ATP-binding protein [Roseovarius sp. SCSIO 43702]